MKSILILILFLTGSVVYSQNKENVELPDNPAEISYRIEEINSDLASLKNRKVKLEENLTIYESLKTSTISTMKVDIQEILRIKNLLKAEKNNDKRILLLQQLFSEFETGFRSTSSILYDLTENISDPELSLLSGKINEIYRNRTLYSKLITYDNSTDKEILNNDGFNDFIKTIDSDFSQETFDSKKNQIQRLLAEPFDKASEKLENIELEIKSLTKERIDLQTKINSKADFDKTIFQWGFPVFIVFILILYLIPLLLFHKRATKDKDDPNSDSQLYKLIYGTGLITEIITVFLLTSTILLLGITDKLAPEILGTLIGGISGYVLGRSFKGIRDPSK